MIDLEHAAERFGRRPLAEPPPIAQLEARNARRQRRQRRRVASIAATALAAAVLVLAGLRVMGSSDAVDVVTQPQPPGPSSTSVGTAPIADSRRPTTSSVEAERRKGSDVWLVPLTEVSNPPDTGQPNATTPSGAPAPTTPTFTTLTDHPFVDEVRAVFGSTVGLVHATRSEEDHPVYRAELGGRNALTVYVSVRRITGPMAPTLLDGDEFTAAHTTAPDGTETLVDTSHGPNAVAVWVATPDGRLVSVAVSTPLGEGIAEPWSAEEIRTFALALADATTDFDG